MFRQAVGQFVTGVTVVAMDVDGEIRAMTANSFTSLSLDPPLVLFCLAKKAHLASVIHMATGFSVNFLTQDQQDLSSYFAGMPRVDPSISAAMTVTPVTNCPTVRRNSLGSMLMVARLKPRAPRPVSSS